MTCTQIWFGTPDRPLAGWYHAPDSRESRGAIVICPPFGMEAACAGDALRELAEDLVNAGFAVLRINYDGTGDSSGDADDPLRVDAWMGSIRSGLDYLGDLGHRWRAVVGLRMGATLAASEIAEHAGVDALVVWDPCLSGRTYLREQRLLMTVVSSEDAGTDDDVHGPGLSFTAETAQAISGLDPSAAIVAIESPTLVLTRSGQGDGRALAAKVARSDVNFVEIEGQLDLLAVDPLFAQTPRATLRRISEWLSMQAPTETVELAPPNTATATVADTAGGPSVLESAITFGADGTFGILTVPSSDSRTTAAIFLNAGVLDHLGPSRLWVELSRRWAELGFRCLRFDFTGVGESPARRAAGESRSLVDAALGQVQAAIATLTDQGATDVVLIGLCSGADVAMRAALAARETGDRIRAVYLINPAFGNDPMEKVVVDASNTAVVARPPRESWFAALGKVDFLVPLARKAPDPVWRLISRFGMTILKADALLGLAAEGIDTFVIGDPIETGSYVRGRRAEVRRVEREGYLAIVTCEPLDHTVLGPLARQRVVAALSAHIAVTTEATALLGGRAPSDAPETLALIAKMAERAGPGRIIFVEADEPPPDLRSDARYKEVWVVVTEEGVPRAVEVVDLAEPDQAIEARVAAAMARVALSRNNAPARAVVVASELPKISVVIPSIVSRVDELANCLDAMGQLDYPDFEVVLVDNRRVLPDDDPLPALVGERPWVRSVRQTVPGISAARNMGIAAARGEIVAFTDDDVHVDTGWLRAIGTRFASDPRLDAVTGLILPAELEYPAQVWFERYYGGFNGERVFEAMTLEIDTRGLRLLRGSQVVVRDSNGKEVRRFAIYGVGAYSAGANMAFKKSSLERIGAFDLALGTGTPARGGEDLATMITILWTGGVVGYEPAAFVHHRHRQGYSELLSQMDGNGLGFTAMLTSLISHDPRHLLVLGAKLPVAVRQKLGSRNAGATDSEATPVPEAAPELRFPSSLAEREFRAYFRGPTAYARSRWKYREALKSEAKG